jgi:hypothetical protein
MLTGPKGVPRSWLVDKWINPMVILQKYLTCEGRYVITFLYHIIILLHFESGNKLNFPYFLWKSLHKMSQQIQRNPRNPLRSLHHHGLINILIMEELHSRGDNWDDFLKRNGFVESIIENSKARGSQDNNKGNDEDLISHGAKGFISHTENQTKRNIVKHSFSTRAFNNDTCRSSGHKEYGKTKEGSG